jgi:phospholipid-binding lipoprotein MlaA
MKRRARRLAAPALLAVALLAGGCATVANPDPSDPWEGFNRKVFAFNDAVDKAVLRPVAEGYRDAVPQLVRTGVSNVLGNVGDAWSAVNHFLQGKGKSGLDMTMRVLTNTLFGIGGLLDPATEMGLKRQSEDFGQTLGRWGVPAGPYLVLPLLGPSSARDGVGRVADVAASPGNIPKDSTVAAGVTVLNIVDTRAALLGVTGLADSVALDRYSFFRQGYLSRRQNEVYDGAPPAEAFEDIGDDPPPPAAKPPASAPTTPPPAAPRPAPR